MRAHGNLKNEVGNKYGMLTVVEYAGQVGRRESLWLCECECGNSKLVKGANLRRGFTRSCGCLKQIVWGV